MELQKPLMAWITLDFPRSAEQFPPSRVYDFWQSRTTRERQTADVETVFLSAEFARPINQIFTIFTSLLRPSRRLETFTQTIIGDDPSHQAICFDLFIFLSFSSRSFITNEIVTRVWSLRISRCNWQHSFEDATKRSRRREFEEKNKSRLLVQRSRSAQVSGNPKELLVNVAHLLVSDLRDVQIGLAIPSAIRRFNDELTWNERQKKLENNLIE